MAMRLGIFGLITMAFWISGCATAPDKDAAGGPNILRNGDFEIWAEAGPAEWQAAQGYESTWNPVGVIKSKDALAGKACLELPNPGEKSLVVVAQSIDPALVKLNQTLTLRAAVKAPTYKQVHVVLSFKRGSERLKERLFSSGGQDWENLLWKLEVPPDADPATFRVEIIRQPLGPGVVLVDKVSVIYE